MNCCQCEGIERLFNQQETAKKLKQYRRKGPDKTTRLLINAFQAYGVEGMDKPELTGLDFSRRGVGSSRRANRSHLHQDRENRRSASTLIFSGGQSS